MALSCPTFGLGHNILMKCVSVKRACAPACGALLVTFSGFLYPGTCDPKSLFQWPDLLVRSGKMLAHNLLLIILVFFEGLCTFCVTYTPSLSKLKVFYKLNIFKPTATFVLFLVTPKRGGTFPLNSKLSTNFAAISVGPYS